MPRDARRPPSSRRAGGLPYIRGRYNEAFWDVLRPYFASTLSGTRTEPKCGRKIDENGRKRDISMARHPPIAPYVPETAPRTACPPAPACARNGEKPPAASREGRPGGFPMPGYGFRRACIGVCACVRRRASQSRRVGRPRESRGVGRAARVGQPSESPGVGRLSTLIGSISKGSGPGLPAIAAYFAATSSAVGSSFFSSTWVTTRSAWSL